MFPNATQIAGFCCSTDRVSAERDKFSAQLGEEKAKSRAKEVETELEELRNGRQRGSQETAGLRESKK